VPASLEELRARVRLPLRVLVGAVIAVYVLTLGVGWLAFARAGDLGIMETSPSAAIAEGRTILRLQSWGAAFRAGIRTGDVVVGFGGGPIGQYLSVAPDSYDLAVGDLATIQIVRAPVDEARGTENIQVVLGSRLERLDLLAEVLVQSVVATLFFALGIVVLLARPDDAPARLFSLATASLGLSQVARVWHYGVHDVWVANLESWPFQLATVATLHFFLAFPTPHPALTRLRGLGPAFVRRARLGTAVLYLVPLAVRLALAAGPVGSLKWWLPFLGFLLVLAVLALARSFRHVTTPAAHAQLLWLTWAVAIGVAAFLLWAVGVLPRPALLLVDACVPIAMGLAILRHGLFDIDVIINRTLVYGVVSAALVLVYLGPVVLIQSLLRLLADQQSGEAVVLSTLVVGVLFQPLRQIVQTFIDRRYYRRHYDAAHVLGAFAATARDEVDLGRLTEALLAVVEDTMQPRHVSLWLRQPPLTTPAAPEPALSVSPPSSKFANLPVAPDTASGPLREGSFPP
jgi:hypothetical protein